MAYPSFTEDDVDRYLLTWVRNSTSLSAALLCAFQCPGWTQ
jgi:hypothetical protein